MTPEDLARLEDILVKAVQSGKAETSDLVSEMVKKLEQSTYVSKEEMKHSLEEYFDRGVEKKKFIDTSRIPLICQDISNIHVSIGKIEDNISWITKLIIGAVVLALLGLLTTSAI